MNFPSDVSSSKPPMSIIILKELYEPEYFPGLRRGNLTSYLCVELPEYCSVLPQQGMIWLFLLKYKLELMFNSIEPYTPLWMYFSGNLFPALCTVSGRRGGLMISALISGSSGPGLSPGRGGGEGDVVLCSWARHLTLTVPLSTQVYKWVPANLMLGVTLRWTGMPSRGE